MASSFYIALYIYTVYSQKASTLYLAFKRFSYGFWTQTPKPDFLFHRMLWLGPGYMPQIKNWEYHAWPQAKYRFDLEKKSSPLEVKPLQIQTWKFGFLKINKFECRFVSMKKTISLIVWPLNDILIFLLKKLKNSGAHTWIKSTDLKSVFN